MKSGAQMIRENQRYFNFILFLLDMAVISLSFIFAWFIRFETSILGFGHDPWGFTSYMFSLVFILPVFFLLYTFFGLYNPHRTKSFISEAKQIIKVNATGLLIILTFLFIIEITYYSRYMLAMFFIFSTTFSIGERYIIRNLLRFIRSKNFNIKYILVIGAGELGKKVVRKIKQNRYMGFNIIGFLDDNIKTGQEIADIEVIGEIKDLDDAILNHQIDRVIITISPRHHTLLEKIVDKCEKHGVKAEIVPDYYRYFPAKPYIDMIDDIPIIDIRYVPLDNSFNQLIKRIMDILLAIGSIIVLSPLLLFIAIMIKITSPGPVIFRQTRVGLHRKNFEMYKFRSMKVQEKSDEEYHWTTKDDEHKTSFGSFIRKTSVDELPQLFNILKGDMSLIGPRPERPYFVKKFREEIPKYMIKHHVRPGMTGWAQIHGYRGNTSIKKRIEYDLYYVENWTLILDIKIFFISLFKGFINKNAY